MKYLTEHEQLGRFQYYTLELEKRLREGEDFGTISNDIPFAVHLNDPETLEVKFTNDKHTELTGHHLDEIRKLGFEYLQKVVHPHTLNTISEMLPPIFREMAPRQTYKFLQYVKLKHEERYSPVITFTKTTDLPHGLVLCISPLVRQLGKFTKKMERVVRMDQFRLKHFSRFQQLTGREVEILKLLAEGNNNVQIAEKLYISRSTVETHRKHINRKLEINSYSDLMKYAISFNLVQL